MNINLMWHFEGLFGIKNLNKLGSIQTVAEHPVVCTQFGSFG
jgi:hypothetical protein